jgi:hypothetical protein
LQPHSSAASPKTRPTPSSHSNSPTNTAPTYGSQTGLSPAASDHVSLRTSAPPVAKPQLSPLPAIGHATRQPVMPPMPANRAITSASFYPTPSFQNHIEQLEQEYDAPADMLDDSEIETPSGPGPYPSPFPNGTQPMTMSPTTAIPGTQPPQPNELLHPVQHGQPYPSMTQLLEGGLDWDPFGLSASMAFPNQFFDQSSMR